jgi:peptidoglycan LD-endopeptidase CwlK
MSPIRDVIRRFFTAPRPAAPAPPAELLTPRDLERLAGVHPDLVRVVKRARGYAAFIVDEGVRSVERQRQMIREGRSRILMARAHLGRHVTGHAVDLYPIIPGKRVADMPREDYAEVVQAMKRAAAEERVEMEHGYDWPWDSPHHELTRRAYPA